VDLGGVESPGDTALKIPNMEASKHEDIFIDEGVICVY